MSIREYVGARYVPKYVGEWDVNAVYEPLSIVTVANVGSYTSKQYVPAGINISNTDYWALSGLYTGQIAALETRVDNIDIAITDINSDIDALEGLRINDGRRVVMIGDSYGHQPSATENWQYLVEPYLNADYVYKMAEDAMGFARTGSYGHTAEQLLDAEYSNIVNPDTITDVIVVLGINDYYVTPISAINTALASFIADAVAKFPNATIWLGNAGFKQGLTRAEKTYLADIIKSIQAYAGRNKHCRPLTGIEFIMHDIGMMGGDGLHPNVYGSGQIANGVACLVNGGQYTYKRSLNGSITWDDGQTSETICAIDGALSSITIRDSVGTISAETLSSALTDIGIFSTGALFENNTFLANCFMYDFDNNALHYGQIVTNKADVRARLLDGTVTGKFRKYSTTITFPTYMA